jgi:hypothetical protein
MKNKKTRPIHLNREEDGVDHLTFLLYEAHLQLNLNITLMDPLYGLIQGSLTIKPKYNPKHKEIKIT